MSLKIAAGPHAVGIAACSPLTCIAMTAEGTMRAANIALLHESA